MCQRGGMESRRAALALILVVFLSATAQAQPASGPTALTPPAPTPPVESTWQPSYRSHLILADAVAGLLLAAVYSQDSAGLEVSWVLTYMLAAPAVHMAHRNAGRVFGSMAVRFTLPLLLIVLGDSLDGANEGLLIGVGTATVFDWVVLGGAKGATRAPAPKPGITVTPTYALSREGQPTVGLGVTGWW